MGIAHNLYEAAVKVGMSLKLLRWLTSYRAKKDIDRKLKIHREEGQMVFFDEEELLSFADWLHQPRPHQPASPVTSSRG
jgi:hypothetical protein